MILFSRLKYKPVMNIVTSENVTLVTTAQWKYLSVKIFPFAASLQMDDSMGC